MFEWVHALATILIINEKAFSGGLKVSEQLRMWQDRMRILATPPWILAPILLAMTDEGTTWTETMTARPVMGSEGMLTIALGEGPTYRELPRLTGFFGLIPFSRAYGSNRRWTTCLKQTTVSKLSPRP